MSINVDREIDLKPLREGEAGELFALVEENRAYLRESMGWLDQNTYEEESLAFIRSHRNSNTYGIHYNGKLVGVISLHRIDPINRYGEIGYWLAEKAQGKGIMRRSVQALITNAFNELNLHRIEIRCAVNNLKSQKIPEALGFTKEGLLKECVSLYDTYLDAYLYGLVNEKRKI